MPEVGGAQSSQGAAGAQTGAATSAGFTMPEKFAGKSSEDIARAYLELEQNQGKMADQYGKMVEAVNQWKQVWGAWDPILQRAGYEPEKMVSMLDAAAAQARDAGQPGRAAQLQAAADRAWHELMDPREQSEFLDKRFGTTEQNIIRQVKEALDAYSKNIFGYVNQYGDLAMKAIDKKLANPEMDVNSLLTEAANIASGKYDPLEWAARIAAAPKEQEKAFEKRLADERKKWQEEQNKELTTFTGAGAGGSSPYRIPPRADNADNGGARQEVRSPSLGNAKENFIKRWPQIVRPPG